MSIAAMLGLEKKGGVNQSESKAALAKQNRQIFNNIRTAPWYKWREFNLNQPYDYFLGDQLTEKELKDLRTVGMPDFINNKITPGIELIKYFLTASDPGWIVAGVDGSDSDIAHVHNGVLQYIWGISSGSRTYGQVIQDALTKSVGYFYVDIDPNSDRGNGDPKFYTIPPEDVFPDPSSRDPLFDDASYILVKKDYTKDYLKRKLPDFANIIDKVSGNDEHTITYSKRDATDSGSIQYPETDLINKEGTDEETIDYYERYEKESIRYVTIRVKQEVTQEDIDKLKQAIKQQVDQYRQQLTVQLQDQAIELRDQFLRGNISQERMQFEAQKAQMDAEQAIQQYEQMAMADAVKAFETVKTYNITEREYDELKKSGEFKDRITDELFYWEDRIRLTVSVGANTFLYQSLLPISYYPIIPIPYLHTGTVYPMSLVQLVVGKQREINKAHQVMIHNASLSGSLRFMYQDGSIEIKKWEKEAARPGGFLPYKRGYEKPIPVAPTPLSNAFFTIIEKGESVIEETIGAFPMMQGDTGSGPETYRGLLAMDEFGTRRIRSWSSNVVEPALERLAHVVTQYAQYLYKAHKIIRIVNPDTNEIERLELNVPIYDDFGNVVERYFDYQSTQFDIKIIPGRTFPVNRWAQRDEYRQWYEAGIIDDIAFIQMTDITNKEQLIKRKSLYAQLSQENEALKEQVKSLTGSMETFKRELEHAGIKEKVTEGTAEISRAVSKVKADLKSEVDQHINAMKLIQDEANLKVRELLVKERDKNSDKKADRPGKGK